MLKKAIRRAKLVAVSDIAHALALLLQHHYRHQPLLEQWLAGLAQSKFKHIMTDAAYLLPPRQRSVARYLNLWQSIEWSGRLLATFARLSAEEQARFAWLKNFRGLINELVGSFGLTRDLRIYVQKHGLSTTLVAHCETLIEGSGCITSLKDNAVGAYHREGTPGPHR